MPQATSLPRRDGPRLHVGLVHESWPPTEFFGGIVRYLVCLADGLRERGHDVTVVTRGTTSVTEHTGNGVRVVRVAPVLRNAPAPMKVLLFHLAMSARYTAALATVHRTHPIDVVEFSNWACEGFAHSIRKARPQVTRVSTMGWQTRDFGLLVKRSRYGAAADRWRDWTEAFPLRRSDLILAPSSEHAHIIARRLGLKSIPEAAAHGTSEEDEANLDAGAPVNGSAEDLLYVGKLEPRKGFDTLVEAFTRAYPSLPSAVRLRVAGSDTAFGPGGSSYRDHVLGPIPASVRRRIDLLGWVSDGALTDLYRRSAAVVAPSRYESFGLPFIEAMQHGKPVIGTTAGGIPDVVSNGVEGILIAPGDVDGLALAMTKVVTDALFRQRLERAARARYEREFTKAAFAARAEATYLRVIEARRQRMRLAGTPA